MVINKASYATIVKVSQANTRRIGGGPTWTVVVYYRNIEIIEGAVCSDHVHLCLSIPPSEKVSDVVGYIKGKSALMIHDKYPEMTNGWTKAFWARGYYVATVGNITEEAVKEYIQRQKEESKREDTRK